MRILLFALAFVGCRGDRDVESTPAPPTRAVGIADLAMFSPKFSEPDASGKTPCEKMTYALSASRLPVAAGLYGTFGKDESCAKLYTDTFRETPHRLRVYLWNGTWLDGDSRGYPGDLFIGATLEQLNAGMAARVGGVISQLVARTTEIVGMLSRVKNEKTEVVVVFALENPLSGNATNAGVFYVEGGLGFETQMNPLDPHGPNLGRVVETHGDRSFCDDGQFQVASEDSPVDHSEAQSAAWLAVRKNCKEVLLHRGEHQGLCVHDGVLIRCVPDPGARELVYNDEEEMHRLIAGAQ